MQADRYVDAGIGEVPQLTSSTAIVLMNMGGPEKVRPLVQLR